MVDSEQPDARRFFLAFVEQHWRDLSLRDALFLSPEAVGESSDPFRKLVSEDD
jgi:hypothetical protein